MKSLIHKQSTDNYCDFEQQCACRHGANFVIERLKQILPNIDLPDFDHSKEKDTLYCVEWGIAKGQWMEQGVLERLINDLTEENGRN